MASTNADEFSRLLTRAGRQIPFSLSLALNRVGEDIQKAQVAHMHRIFTVRVPSFIGTPEAANRSAIKRTQKATKAKPVVELAVLPPGGLQRADIITRHERDRERRPKGKSLAVPVEARRGKKQKVPGKLRPKALDFQPHGSTGRVFRGKERTFLVRTPSGGVIYQRTSRRRGGKRRRRGQRSDNHFAGTRVLYRLEPTTPLTPRLAFHENAERVFTERFADQFAKAYEEALKTAR